MTEEDKAAKGIILKRALHVLGEHFGAVQILASCSDGAGTEGFSMGVGDWYARQGLAREFIEKDTAREIAYQVKKSLIPTEQ